LGTGERPLMRLARVLAATLFIALGLIAAPASVLAAEPTFGEQTASASLGQPLTFTTTIDNVNGGTVDLLLRLFNHQPQIVVPAHPGTVEGGWQVSDQIDVASSSQCACFISGPSAPNTKIEYQFRVTAADGTTTLGPLGNVTVTDDRFQWQTLSQDMVTVHWYEGDQQMAQDAATAANEAIDTASQLLGVTLPAPVDLFVYATQQALLDAVSPSRENIAGEAHSDIATMFVWLGSSDAAVTVKHELTHLVFNEATQNPYHEAPRWLNEGVAVYLSEGYSQQFKGVVDGNAAANSLIPLEGLAGFFPSPYDQFFLAYGESVSAVDYFVRTYSEETLWNLVKSYADGLSDDDAFTAATGGDMAAFNAAWMASLNSTVPEPLGPQPAPPGPVPSAWLGGVQPTPAPGSSVVPGTTSVPGRTANPGEPNSPPPSSTVVDVGTGILIGVLIGVLVLVGVVAVIALVNRSNRNRQPPAPPQY